MNEEEVNQFRQQNHTNMDFINNNSFMLLRVDTSPLLRRLRKDLSGKIVYQVQDKEGNIYEEEKQIGKPIANEEGVLRISNIVEEIVNTHTVQGNLKQDQYVDFIANTREEIANVVSSNCIAWEMDDKDINGLVDKIMRILILFLTRPIGNKERESYQKEFQSKEIIQTQPEKKGFINTSGGL